MFNIFQLYIKKNRHEKGWRRFKHANLLSNNKPLIISSTTETQKLFKEMNNKILSISVVLATVDRKFRDFIV